MCLREAVAMRFASVNFRLVLACALAGMAVAGVVAYRIPNRYISESVAQAPLCRCSFYRAGQVLSRTTLSLLIAGLDLYHSERPAPTMEDVVAHMKRDLGVRDWPPADGKHAFAVRYQIPIRRKRKR